MTQQAKPSSLAAQLSQLKVQQKDEIALPSRTKISFLFDVKQAANIDDQTLFYICQSGVAALESTLDLSVFQSDLLCEKSLQFYRATETAETLAPIDKKLEVLLKLLAPHALDSACHKVLEYLIRIYEVHVYHKTVLLNAFLPFFETAYFLRVAQLLNLEKDQEYGFLHQFAYQGSSIDKATLVKCLGRNSGLIFTKYAQFCFSLLEIGVDSVAASISQHWRFFGSMMVELLRSNTNDQNLMFNCLPYISKALKQGDVRDLRISAFLAISQLACRKTLSEEYTQAFVRQTLQTVAAIDIGDEDLRLKGLTVVLFLAMYQPSSLQTLKAKDFKLLATKLVNVDELLEALSNSYDTSALAKVILMTALKDESVSMEQTRHLMGGLVTGHLKTTFTLVQTAIFESVDAVEASKERVQSALELLKDLQPQEFKQSVIYLLRRLQGDPILKQKVLAVLSGEGSDSKEPTQSNLISTFGDQEYSILNALSSQSNATKMSALRALQDSAFVTSLLPNERSLVLIVLLQTISQQAQTPEVTSLMLTAIVTLKKVSSSGKESASEKDDTQFECLESLLDLMYTKGGSTYPADLKEQLADVLVDELTVGKQENQIKQIWIALTFQSGSIKLTQARNAYFGYLTAASLTPAKEGKSSVSSAPKKLASEALVQSFVAKPIQAVKFLLSIFSDQSAGTVHSYLDYSKVASLLLKLGQTTKTNMMRSTFTQQLYTPLLQAIKTKTVPHADKILASIASSIAPFEQTLQESQSNLLCLQELLSVAVQQKKTHSADFNFSGLLQTIFETTLARNKTLFCDFLVQIAFESECPTSRVFACLQLTNMHANVSAGAKPQDSSVLSLGVCLSQEIASGLLLVLLNDQSSQVRYHAIQFAQSYEKALGQASADANIVKCFSADKKIVSQAKRSADNFAPLDKTVCLSLIKTLLKVKMELVQDTNQLGTTLAKVKDLEVFEPVVRSLNDLPSFESKSRLLSALSLVPSQTHVFAMNLCKVQDKLFVEVEQQSQKSGKMEPECLTLLVQLAQLVASQHRQSLERKEGVGELMVSLVLPYLKYVTESQELVAREISSSIKQQASIEALKDAVVALFEKNVILEACLQGQDDLVIREVFRLYLSLQSGLLKGSNQRLKSLFIDNANGRVFTGSQLAMVLEQTTVRMLEDKTDTQGLDVLLETIVQVALTTTQSRDLLNQEATSLIAHLVDAFVNNKNDEVQASEYAFTIELAAQLCLQTISQKKKAAFAPISEDSPMPMDDSAKLILKHTRGLVAQILAREDVETQDPFNEFMAAENSGKKSKVKSEDPDEEMKGEDQSDDEGDEQDSTDEQLLPSYQITLSLVSLLTKLEVTRNSKLTHSASMLKEIADFVRETSQADSKQVLKQKELTHALYRLYQSAILKTFTTIANSSEATHLEDLSLRDCLVDYIDLTVDLFDGPHEELMQDGRPFLQAVATAGFSEYAFLGGLILIRRAAKDMKLRVAETLEIDCSTPKASGSALYLLKKLLLQAIDTEESLETIEMLLYAVSQVKFSDQIEDFLEEKTRLVFASEGETNPMRTVINGLQDWFASKVLGTQKLTRKFLFLAVSLLEQWLGSAPEFQSRLARLAGTETPSQQIQNQLVNCFLCSYLVAQSNTVLLNSEQAHADKTFKSSLLRLSRNTKKLQQALNEMFSLQIHVEIVLKILNFGTADDSTMSAKDQLSLLPLKNNCLQLLNEKMSSYSQGFLAKATKPLQAVFKRLVERAVQFLTQFESTFSSKGNSVAHQADTVALCESLLAALQFTCCAKSLPRSLQEDSLQIVQAYQSLFSGNEQRLKHLQLQTQLTLTEFYMFEAYSLSVLEHLPAFFSHVVEGFAKVKETMRKESEQFLFADTFQAALLKASISISALFFKFLNASQLEALLTAVITTKAASSNVADESNHVSIVLDTIGLEAKTHKKLIVHATFNAYHGVVTQSIGTNAFEKQALRYFSELLCPVFRNLPAKFVQEHSQKFTAFLKECFNLTSKAAKQDVSVSDAITDSIVQCFNTLVVKLNEEQLRPVVLKVTKWAMREKAEQAFDFQKALMLCKLLAGVLNTLKELFVPLMAIFFEPALMLVLSTLTKLLKGTSSNKRSRAEAEHSGVSQELQEDLLKNACLTLQLLFKHDSSCFIQNDSFEKLCDPVADLLTLLKVEKFLGFVEQTVKPLVYEMNDRINDDAMWVKLNYAVMMQTRSEQWQTRQGALLVIEHLFDSMRERYLVVLNDTIPFLSELLEDEHEQVEGTAKRIVARVEQMTGESINDYLK